MTKPRAHRLLAFAAGRGRKVSGWKSACAILLFCASIAIASSAQTFTTLATFDGTNGANPEYAPLVQGFDGNYYGTASEGGANLSGTVFKINAAGTLTTLHSFDSTDGNAPYAGLVQATNGNFYGTTEGGGANNVGTIFAITPGGTLTTLHSFDSTDGNSPYAGLIQAANGNFYGTTQGGGADNLGTVFDITAGGTLTTLQSFTGSPTEGAYPYAGLVQATNGSFYGITELGGSANSGEVFELSSAGTLTTLYSFCPSEPCLNGSFPYGGLVQASNGNFYGTTYSGGTNGHGTVFEITAAGTLTTIYNFCNLSGCADGNAPHAGLVQGTDGNFYGTTGAGGANGNGTVFKLTSAGVLTTLHSFDYSDGAFPYGGLIQATNGTFYGTTYEGGASSDGTIFSLATGLGAFVETNPTSGKVGAKVTILGNSLKGSTAVTFDGTTATFTVISNTEITATVPTGAKTGKVAVTTPKKTLKSNVNFRVP